MNDTIFFQLQRQAAAWYQANEVLAYRLIPICLIGFLLALGMHFGKSSKLFGLFAALAVVNIGLLVMNYYILILHDFLGIALMLGFAAGGCISKVKIFSSL